MSLGVKLSLLTAVVLLSIEAGRMPLYGAARAAQPAGQPKLIVVFVADQMRADYLERYASKFTGGLHRLMENGAWFQHAAYPYLNTITCAGHSTIGTGTFPYKHGMVLNAWFNRETGKMMTCTEDPSVKEVSFTDTPGIADSAKNIKQPSLAELMER